MISYLVTCIRREVLEIEPWSSYYGFQFQACLLLCMQHHMMQRKEETEGTETRLANEKLLVQRSFNCQEAFRIYHV